MTRDTSDHDDAQDRLTDTTRRGFMRTAAAGATAVGLGAGATAAGGAAQTTTTTVSFDFSNLPPLSMGHYEGWAIFGDEKVSTGTFSKGDDYVFEVDRDLSMADKIVVTIEPDGDDDSAPSGVPVLVGTVEGSTADLSFPVSFADASGSYILNTPTAPEAPAQSGIWFLDPSEGPSASLDLPSLPGGWTYEGWVVHEGMPISTGRFADPTMADDAAPYSGSESAPPFPGEDLVQNAPGDLSFPTDLTDGASKAVVSVEPDIDGMDPTGPAPFQVKPLAGTIPADAEAGTDYDLPRKTGTEPSGMATIQRGEMRAVSFDFSNLPPLSMGHYEGWAIFGDEKVSTGTFSKGDDYMFETDRDLSMADKIVVTIEPDDDDDPAPSGVPVLTGSLTGGMADLSFPVSFSESSGSYILNTPTAPEAPPESGIWFLDPSDGPAASLALPSLPGGWTYEGWVVHEGMPISTGRFDDPTMADDAAPYSGSESAPPFPGEDLVQNAPGDLSFPTDLTDGASKAVVSVEPDIDGMDPTGPAPFQVKPLAGMIPADAQAGTSYDLPRKTGTKPSGTAMLHEGGTDEPALLLNDFTDWPGDNALGKWSAAAGFEHASVDDATLRLEYDDSGWLVSNVSQSITETPVLKMAVSGDAGGEQRHVTLRIGGDDYVLADLTDDTIDTSTSVVAVDLTQIDQDLSYPGVLQLSFWRGGAGAVEIDWIGFDARSEDDPMPPMASFSASETIVPADTTVEFDASASERADSYEWAFGDGTTATGQMVSHSYAESGMYTVELTVSTDDGMTDMATTTISVDMADPDYPEWDYSTLYETGDRVVHDGMVWEAMYDSLNAEPSTSGHWWEQVSDQS